MARLLTPKDYGLIGMLAIFLAIAQSLIDSGFSQALIRKKHCTEIDYSTVFYFNIGIGLILYLLLFFTAPLVAEFYNIQELCLVMRIISISLIINSLVVVQRALLTIKIDFKTQAKASLTAAIISGCIGIGLAYLGHGVWALVYQQLLNLSINTLLLWIMSCWRPSLTYSWKSFRELFSFGSKLLLSGLLDTTYKNIYSIVIGKAFSAGNLGYYTRAQQFAQFPSSNITGILQRVTYPVLCNIQDDNKRLAEVYRKFLKLSAFVIFPLMTGLAAVAHPFILLTIGEQWSFCAILLQIISFGMMWYPIHAINLNLLQVKGRSDLFLRLEVIKKIVGVIILCITLPLGLVAMCFGQIASSIIALIINTYYTGKLTGVGFFIQIRDLVPTLLLSLSMFTLIFFSIPLMPTPSLQLLLGILIGIAYYITVSYLFHFRELKEIVSLISKKTNTVK